MFCPIAFYVLARNVVT